jgi:hypothetical protein
LQAFPKSAGAAAFDQPDDNEPPPARSIVTGFRRRAEINQPDLIAG